MGVILPPRECLGNSQRHFFGGHKSGWEPGKQEVGCWEDSPTHCKILQDLTWFLNVLPGTPVGKPVYNYLSLKPNCNLHILLPRLIHTKFSMHLQLPCTLREGYILFRTKLCQELDTERIMSLAAVLLYLRDICGCRFAHRWQAFDYFFMLSICTCLNIHYFIMNYFPFVSSFYYIQGIVLVKQLCLYNTLYCLVNFISG